MQGLCSHMAMDPQLERCYMAGDWGSPLAILSNKYGEQCLDPGVGASLTLVTGSQGVAVVPRIPTMLKVMTTHLHVG